MVNPAAQGFNQEASDAKAINLADEVMEAMGGRPNWDQTQYVYWSFFGRRTLLWDKFGQRVRIESLPDSTIYLVDLKNKSGKVKRGSETIEQPDSLAKYVKKGESIWINDAYWLVMPFKLKDTGVTLKYAGQDTTQMGKIAEVLELTFDSVGDTPENKYRVYVDPESKLVIQWDFYRNAGDEKPGFSTPWGEYQKYGNIMLSGDRGERDLTDIAVYTKVAETAFTSFDPVDVSAPQ
ncbi:MAG: hypothetical protein DHS20C18_16570 [Saprospiraceae bacterium]|nr:MAG: hypothetical protein DHS20C18_16570 [Saprospiraceae bacterium]